jgi:hypothetical protein
MEKYQTAEGLILRGCGDLSFNGKMGQKSFNFGATHFIGVTLVVKRNIPPNPIGITLFSAVGIVLEADGIADLIEELAGWWFD